MTISTNELISELNALIRLTEAEAAVAASRTVQAVPVRRRARRACLQIEHYLSIG